MEHIPDAIYFKDAASRFLMISHAHTGKFGLQHAEQAVGKTDADFFTPAHAQQALADEQRILKTGEPLVDWRNRKRLLRAQAVAEPRTSAEPRKPMSLLDIAELPAYPRSPAVAGRKSRRLHAQPGRLERGPPIYHLWRQDTQGGAPVQLTTGARRHARTDAMVAGRFVDCLRPRPASLMLLPLGGAVANRARSPGTRPACRRRRWSPDGTPIYFIAADAPTADERERDRRKDDVYALDENVKARQLWSVSVASGAENAISRPAPLSVLSYRLSRDGSLLVVERAPTPLEDDKHHGEAVGDGRRRRQRPRGDAQRHRGSPAGALAGQQPDPVPRRDEREARAVLQLEPVRDAGDGRHAEPAAAATFRTRSTRPRGRPTAVDPGRRQHGRAQRDHPDRRGARGSGRR